MLSSFRPRGPGLLPLALLALCLPAHAQSVTPQTPLLLPAGLVFDPAGNLYIAERARHTVCRLSSAGMVSTVAGTGVQAFSGDGGPALQATFNDPSSVAIDTHGNLFVADTGNHRIRRVDAVSGIITTVAGIGQPGFSGDGGPATAASLRAPAGLVLDAAGNLDLADTGNQRVRRIDLRTGIITTIVGTGVQGFAGDGASARLASLDTPTALALTPVGDLLIADTRNGRVRKLSAGTGQISTVATGLRTPAALAVNTDGTLLIAEAGRQRVLRLDPQTSATTVLAGTGTQAFTGDGSSAAAAALNTPAGLALAPDGALWIADSGNSRLRRLVPPLSAATPIQTVLGPGSRPHSSLSIAGASTTLYGSGALTATLAGGSDAHGSLVLLEVTASSSTPLASAALAGGYGSFSTASLSAGTHQLLVSYSGDATHGAALSSAWTLTVQPLPVTATPAPATMLFGQNPPALTGALQGILPADAAQIAVVLTSAASATSTPGAYPIAASLTGPAAGNYSLSVAPAAVIISKAPSTIAIDPPIASPTTLTVHINSTTSGAPSGMANLLDSGTPVTSGTLDPAGRLTLTLGPLSAGSHLLSVTYGGDANFLGSQSSPISVAILPTAPVTQPDFAFTSAATIVSVLSGASTSVPITVAYSNGSLPGPIALAASGLPPFSSATFDPPVIPPGGAVSGFRLTVTTAASARLRASGPIVCVLLLPLACLARRRRPARLARTCCLALIASLPLTGCGDRIAAGTSGPRSAPTLYTVTVTGTATTADGTLLKHSTTVQLSVTP